jgi:SAM-dependent methyltransferase
LLKFTDCRLGLCNPNVILFYAHKEIIFVKIMQLDYHVLMYRKVYKVPGIKPYLLKDVNGIYFPMKNLLTRDKYSGVSERYRSQALLDFEKYQYNTVYRDLFLKAKSHFQFSIPKVTLELGCGAGNLTLPFLQNSNQKILATDISREQLEILSIVIENLNLSNRVNLIQIDNSKFFFKEYSFELIIGAAIAHHLIDPITLFELAIKGLKVNGSLLLFEPILSGSLIVREAIIEIVSKLENSLPHDVLIFLNDIAIDIRERSDEFSTKSLDQRKQLDDKSFVDIDLIRKNFSNISIEVMPILDHSLGSTVSQHIKNILSMYLGWSEFSKLPQDFWQILNNFDIHFDTSQESPVIEGAIHVKRLS